MWDKEQATVQARRAFTLSFVGLAVFVVAPVSIGLARKGKDVLAAGDPGRDKAQKAEIIGWVGIIGWTMAFLMALAIIASGSKSTILLSLGQVGSTLLILILGSAAIAALVYLILGVTFKRREWITAVPTYHLVVGGLTVAGAIVAFFAFQPTLDILARIGYDVSGISAVPGGNLIAGAVALVLGGLGVAVGVLLRRQIPWARTVSAILSALYLLLALVVAGLSLSPRTWPVAIVAAILTYVYALWLSVVLSPGKTRFALPFTLLSPAIVGLCLLVIYPTGYEIAIAFSNMRLRAPYFQHPLFGLAQGWENFKLVFTEPVLKQVMFFPLLGRTVLWTVIQVPCHVIGGMALALLLNRPMKLRGLYRALLVIPWALPPIIAILAWRGEFHYEYGFINIMLRDIGLQAVQWKSDPTANFIAMNIVNIWLGIPFMMVILLGGLQSIPQELYEAAEIDGASWWQQFRKITLPLLQPVMTPAIILGVIWTFNNFNVSFFINENELESSDLLVTALFRSAFEYNRYGFAAAFALVIFLILLIFSIFYIRFTGALKGGVEK